MKISGRLICGPENIWNALYQAAAESERMDICSYWAGTGMKALELLHTHRNSRIIVGGLSQDEKVKAISMAHAVRNIGGRVAYLEGCHIKLYIFHQKWHSIAFLGSMNLGQGMRYELLVKMDKDASHEATCYFNNLWHIAEPVNATVLRDVRLSLATAVFEQKATDQSQKP